MDLSPLVELQKNADGQSYGEKAGEQRQQAQPREFYQRPDSSSENLMTVFFDVYSLDFEACRHVILADGV